MIQRIQTLYLLIITILNSLLFILPLNVLALPSSNIKISILGLYSVKDGLSTLETQLFPLLALTSIIILIAFVTIFLYKKRKLQMRLSLYNSVLGLGLSFLAIYFTTQEAELNHTQISFSIGLIIPIIGSILSFLAFKAIKKDDDLVRSIDRIR